MGQRASPGAPRLHHRNPALHSEDSFAAPLTSLPSEESRQSGLQKTVPQNLRPQVSRYIFRPYLLLSLVGMCCGSFGGLFFVLPLLPMSTALSLADTKFPGIRFSI